MTEEIKSGLAHDLSQIPGKTIEELKAESQERQEENEEVMKVVRWDRAMKRAFRGIIDRPSARAAVKRAYRRHGEPK